VLVRATWKHGTANTVCTMCIDPAAALILRDVAESNDENTVTRMVKTTTFISYESNPTFPPDTLASQFRLVPLRLSLPCKGERFRFFESEHRVRRARNRNRQSADSAAPRFRARKGQLDADLETASQAATGLRQITISTVIAVPVSRVESLGSVAHEYRLIVAAIFSAHFEGSLYGNLGSNFVLQVRTAARNLRPLDNFGPPGSCTLCNGPQLSKQFPRVVNTLATREHGSKYSCPKQACIAFRLPCSFCAESTRP